MEIHCYCLFSGTNTEHKQREHGYQGVALVSGCFSNLGVCLAMTWLDMASALHQKASSRHDLASFPCRLALGGRCTGKITGCTGRKPKAQWRRWAGNRKCRWVGNLRRGKQTAVLRLREIRAYNSRGATTQPSSINQEGAKERPQVGGSTWSPC
jgi:hypothetical protein